MKTERKFFVKLSSGDKFRISELDFNNIKGRLNKGSTNGWYIQRGESFDDVHGWSIQFKDIAGFWADSPELKDREIRNIDIEKRLPPQVGKLEPENTEACNHNWNDEETWTHVTTIVDGVNRYYKQCNTCGAKSRLIKKREVELAQEKKGLTIDDVELVK
jgi:hypothetical protein